MKKNVFGIMLLISVSHSVRAVDAPALIAAREYVEQKTLEQQSSSNTTTLSFAEQWNTFQAYAVTRATQAKKSISQMAASAHTQLNATRAKVREALKPQVDVFRLSVKTYKDEVKAALSHLSSRVRHGFLMRVALPFKSPYQPDAYLKEYEKQCDQNKTSYLTELDESIIRTVYKSRNISRHQPALKDLRAHALQEVQKARVKAIARDENWIANLSSREQKKTDAALSLHGDMAIRFERAVKKEMQNAGVQPVIVPVDPHEFLGRVAGDMYNDFKSMTPEEREKEIEKLAQDILKNGRAEANIEPRRPALA